MLIFLGSGSRLLLLDFVVFKSTWDWVQDGSWWFRFIGLVAAHSSSRASSSSASPGGSRPSSPIRRWRPCSVALHRKSSATGSSPPWRWLTSSRPGACGYSADMIRQTITKAADVGTVDVQAVFNWRQLRLMELLALGIPLAIVAVGFIAHAISARDFQPRHAAWKLFHVAAITGERDLLLWDTP